MKSDARPEVAPATYVYEATGPILAKHDQEVQTFLESDAEGVNVEEAAVQVDRGRGSGYDTRRKHQAKTR